MTKTDLDEFQKEVPDQVVESMGRRGKYLLLPDRQGLDFPFADGGASILLSGPGSWTQACPCFFFQFEDGGTLCFEDVRKFGTMELLAPDLWMPTLFLKN